MNHVNLSGLALEMALFWMSLTCPLDGAFGIAAVVNQNNSLQHPVGHPIALIPTFVDSLFHDFVVSKFLKPDPTKKERWLGLHG